MMVMILIMSWDTFNEAEDCFAIFLACCPKYFSPDFFHISLDDQIFDHLLLVLIQICLFHIRLFSLCPDFSFSDDEGSRKMRNEKVIFIIMNIIIAAMMRMLMMVMIMMIMIMIVLMITFTVAAGTRPRDSILH